MTVTIYYNDLGDWEEHRLRDELAKFALLFWPHDDITLQRSYPPLLTACDPWDFGTARVYVHVTEKVSGTTGSPNLVN